MNATHRATRRAIGVEARRPRCNFLHRRNANHDTASHTVNTGLRRRDRAIDHLGAVAADATATL
jgi:hypothetical protein